MLDVDQFRSHVIRPALEVIGLWTEAAEDLVLGTALQESGLRYLKQLNDGPALGFFQMEPATHDDIHANFLDYRYDLKSRVCGLTGAPFAYSMVGNLWYAAAMCRVHYLRAPEAIPDTLEGQAWLWKKRYNTELGKGTVEEYLTKWERYIGR